MRHFLLFLSLLSSLIGGALIGAPSANASSVYDDVIQTTNYFGTPSCDFSNNFPALIDNAPLSGGGGPGQNPLSGCNLQYARTTSSEFPDWQSFKDLWARADSWSLSTYGTSPVYNVINISPSPSDFVFEDLGGGTLAFTQYTTCTTLDPCFSVQVYDDGTPGYDATVYFTPIVYPGLDRLKILTRTDALDYKLYLIDGNYSVSYPPNYEGIEPPVPEPPVDYTDWTPDWYISFGFDYEVTIHDTHFNTFDDNPFLCDTGLAPAVEWTIRDSSDDILYSGIQSPTMQIVRKLPVSNMEQDYSISGIYNCGPDDLQFDQYGVLDFTLTDTGLLQQTTLADCFQGDFPFIIDTNACMSYFSPIFSLLSFGQIKLDESWNYGNTGCGYLSVLHTWIGLPNSTMICPQFSDTVRNVVTPFLSVILGLVTLGFIARLDNNRGGI